MILGALSAFLFVGLGAFGAHVLRGAIAPNLLAVYQTGVQYQGIHALGLIGAGLLALNRDTLWVRAAGGLFLLGTLFFSGSLYLLAITGTHSLGAVTPLGGVCFMLGWLALAIAAWKLR